MNQIQVNENPIWDQLWTGSRQIILIMTAYLVGRGILAQDTAGIIVSISAIAVPFIIGQLSTRNRAKQLATIAKAVPDSVAVVK